MNTTHKIALSIPSERRPGRYFSVRLKQGLHAESSEYAMPGKLFAISDIEGNFRAFYGILIRHKVIDKYLNWTFNDGHLVILGDCFDRGKQVMECLWLIYRLEEKAQKDGGKVHFILGNHEIMNMNGDWRYVHPKYAKRAGSQKSVAALYDGNTELWRWLKTKNIIEKIGDILFAHGGISSTLNEFKFSIHEINSIARTYYTQANNWFTDPFLHTLFNSDHSPFWYRGYYDSSITQVEIDAILTQYDTKTIVTGHTKVEKVSSFFNGKVINIDTDHATGNSEGLFIKNEKFYRGAREGKRERIK